MSTTNAEAPTAALVTSTIAPAAPAPLPDLPPATAPTTQTGYRYIVKTPGIRGGNARIENTRIGVHDVVVYWLFGRSIEEIIEGYPDITRAQFYECLAYYEDHKAEIDELVRINTSDPNE